MSATAFDQSIPILGQRFRLTGCTLLPTLTCSCGKGESLTLIAQFVGGGQWRGVTSQCSGCGTPYLVRSVATDATGQLQIGIDVGAPPPRDS